MEPRSPEARAFVESAIGQGLLTDESLWFRLVARDGEYLFVSPSVRDFLGYRPEDFVTMAPQEFIHPDELPVAGKLMAAIDVGPVNAIYRMKHKNGEYVWVSSHVEMRDGLMVIVGRRVPERLRGAGWKHVEPFL